MAHKQPVSPSDWVEFAEIIDARSPAEFAADRIPGAVNCPVLDDDERAQVGTMYKQIGAFEAKRLGAALVAANLARHLREVFAHKPANWRPLVYCWRGGLRSGAMVNWLRMVGWDAQQLTGGYKAFRAYVMRELAAGIARLDLRVVCGATGSAKTAVLQAMAQTGSQVIDLEALACHKGSVLGALPNTPQPTQKGFETALWHAISGLDYSKPVFVEGESAKIGRVALPLPLVARMRAAPVVEIVADFEARLAYLLRDYAWLGANPTVLAERLGYLRALQGAQVVERWQAWAHAGELSPLFAQLMAQHYDPHYARAHARHFYRWEARQIVRTAQLMPADIARLAAVVASAATSA